MGRERAEARGHQPSIKDNRFDMKVAIATPTHDGNVTYEYLHSLRALESDLRENQIQSTLITLEGTTLAFARNTFASIVMNDKSYTHLLFVDADMGFMPEAVMKLIRSGYAVTGCIYPTRQLNLVKLHAASRSMIHPEQAQLAAADYVAATALERNDRGQYVIKDGFVRTRRIGMGIALIRREALEEMAHKLPELVSSSDKDRYYATAVKGPVLQCFANIYADGVLCSEDTSFCLRWIQCGGEIWALIDQTIIHVGRNKFRGNLAKSMQILASAPSDLPAPRTEPSGVMWPEDAHQQEHR